MGQQSAPFLNSLAGRVLIDNANERVLIIDNNNIPVALFGKDSQGNIVIKVAKPGFNVLTTTDNNLIFNSEQDIFKIVHLDTFSFSPTDFISSGNAYLTKLATQIIDLNIYGVTNPIVLAYVLDPLGNTIPLPYYSFDYDTGKLDWQAVSRVDSNTNTFYVEVRSITALSPGVTFTYYVLQETTS